MQSFTKDFISSSINDVRFDRVSSVASISIRVLVASVKGTDGYKFTTSYDTCTSFGLGVHVFAISTNIFELGEKFWNTFVSILNIYI